MINGVNMICDDCKYLEFRNKYKIICKLHDGQLLDVKKCQNFRKSEDE